MKKVIAVEINFSIMLIIRVSTITKFTISIKIKDIKT